MENWPALRAGRRYTARRTRSCRCLLDAPCPWIRPHPHPKKPSKSQISENLLESLRILASVQLGPCFVPISSKRLEPKHCSTCLLKKKLRFRSRCVNAEQSGGLSTCGSCYEVARQTLHFSLFLSLSLSCKGAVVLWQAAGLA